MTYGWGGRNHPIMLGRRGVLHYHPTANIVIDESTGTILDAGLDAWCQGTVITREFADLAMLINESYEEVTGKPVATHGGTQTVRLLRNVQISFSIRQYPYSTPNRPARGTAASPSVQAFPLWLLARWKALDAVAIAVVTDTLSIAEGMVGNWWPSLSFRQPLRGIQMIDVTLTQADWAEYRLMSGFP